MLQASATVTVFINHPLILHKEKQQRMWNEKIILHLPGLDSGHVELELTATCHQMRNLSTAKQCSTIPRQTLTCHVIKHIINKSYIKDCVPMYHVSSWHAVRLLQIPRYHFALCLGHWSTTALAVGIKVPSSHALVFAVVLAWVLRPEWKLMESQTLFSEICRTVEHMIITYVRGMWRLSCVFIISNLYIYPIVSLSDCKILAEPYTLYTSFLTCFYSVSLCVCACFTHQFSMCLALSLLLLGPGLQHGFLARATARDLAQACVNHLLQRATCLKHVSCEYMRIEANWAALCHSMGPTCRQWSSHSPASSTKAGVQDSQFAS